MTYESLSVEDQAKLASLVKILYLRELYRAELKSLFGQDVSIGLVPELYSCFSKFENLDLFVFELDKPVVPTEKGRNLAAAMLLSDINDGGAVTGNQGFSNPSGKRVSSKRPEGEDREGDFSD